MDADFWHERWRDLRIGFHQNEPTPLMQKHWASVGAPESCRVFVPLAGKSLDMLWFARRGYHVLGVELSRIAVETFFDENGLKPEISKSGYGSHYRAGVESGEIELICGDAFALDRRLLADCAAVFDRAALIALPAQMRERYVDELYALLPSGCRGMLITLEYPQHEKQGPPFSVPEREVRMRYDEAWKIDTLERRDILSTQQIFIDEGVTALETIVYRLEKR